MQHLDPTKKVHAHFFQNHLIVIMGNTLFAEEKVTSSKGLLYWLSKVIRWFSKPSTHMQRISDHFQKLIRQAIQTNQPYQARLICENFRMFEESVILRHNKTLWCTIFFWTKVPRVSPTNLESRIEIKEKEIEAKQLENKRKAEELLFLKQDLPKIYNTLEVNLSKLCEALQKRDFGKILNKVKKELKVSLEKLKSSNHEKAKLLYNYVDFVVRILTAIDERTKLDLTPLDEFKAELDNPSIDYSIFCDAYSNALIQQKESSKNLSDRIKQTKDTFNSKSNEMKRRELKGIRLVIKSIKSEIKNLLVLPFVSDKIKTSIKEEFHSLLDSLNEVFKPVNAS